MRSAALLARIAPTRESGLVCLDAPSVRTWSGHTEHGGVDIDFIGRAVVHQWARVAHGRPRMIVFPGRRSADIEN
jgi:hypothetical protein